MSIAAMNWALKARTDGVSAQCVLMVVADSANERGISFHADPDYIAERTRQSRATVFRRLKELEAAGALIRVKRFRDDGAQIYEIRLRLESEVDYETVPASDDDEAQDVETKSQIETAVESQIETGGISPVRQVESHSCDSISPSKSPKEEKSPPYPPRGGVRAIDEDSFEEDVADLAAVYPSPITNLPKVRSLLAPMPHERRQKVVTAAKGYADFLADLQRKRKPRAARDAHRWIAADEWTGFVMAGERAAAHGAAPGAYEAGSREGRAVLALGKVARYAPLRFKDGRVGYRGEMTPQLLALADLAPDTPLQTHKFGEPGFWAWLKFIRKTFEGCNLRALTELEAPGPWPPKADGTVYLPGSDPPQERVEGMLATEQDLAEMAKG